MTIPPYTPLTPNDVSILLNHPVESITVSHLPGGLANSNFKVVIGADVPVLIKVCDEKDTDSLQAQIDLLLYLQSRGFETNQPLKWVDGSYVKAYRGSLLTLLSYIEGTTLQHTPSTAADIGRSMARLHCIPTPPESVVPHTMSPFFLTPDGAGQLAAAAPAHEFVTQTLVLWLDKLGAVWDSVDGMERGVLHGDVCPSNVVVGGHTVLVDWEEAGVGPVVLDLAMAVAGYCFVDGRLDQTLFSALLLSYESERRVPCEEHGVLMDCVGVCLLSIAAWRFRQFNLTRPEITAQADCWREITRCLDDLSAFGGIPLDLDESERTALVELAMSHINAYLARLTPHKPGTDMTVPALCRAVSTRDPPEHGRTASEVLAFLTGPALALSMPSASEGFLGYIPGGGIFTSAVADLIADSLNKFVGTLLPAPGLVTLECDALRWLCGVVGFGDGSGGLFTTGASMAVLQALFAARVERFGADGITPEFLKATVYVSAQSHHSLGKAAVLAGVAPSRVRHVAVSVTDLAMDVAALKAMIDADREAGLVPWVVIASAGTTNTGAVDPLAAIADVADECGAWLHVDGAYGGFFALTERGKQRFLGMERARSIALDPHKGLFVPYGLGCLLVSDRAVLRRAFGGATGNYMCEYSDDEVGWEFNNMSLELSRDFRGLRVWLPIMLHGLGKFRAALDDKLDLAEWAAAELSRRIKHARVSLSLSVVSFRVVPPGIESTDALNRAVMDRVNACGRVFLTGTTVPMEGEEVFVVRFCILSFRTNRRVMEAAVEDVVSAVEELVVA